MVGVKIFFVQWIGEGSRIESFARIADGYLDRANGITTDLAVYLLRGICFAAVQNRVGKSLPKSCFNSELDFFGMHMLLMYARHDGIHDWRDGIDVRGDRDFVAHRHKRMPTALTGANSACQPETRGDSSIGAGLRVPEGIGAIALSWTKCRRRRRQRGTGQRIQRACAIGPGLAVERDGLLGTELPPPPTDA